MPNRFLSPIDISGNQTVKGNEFVIGDSLLSGNLVISNNLTANFGDFTDNVTAKALYGDGSHLTGMVGGGGGSSALYLPLSGGTLTGSISGIDTRFNSITSNTITVSAYKDYSKTTLPSYNAGRLSYSQDVSALTYYNEVINNTIHIGREIQIQVKNKSGAQINKGQVVYVSKATGQVPDITLARSNALSSSIIVGITNQNIPDNANGYVVATGRIEGVNTGGFTAGNDLYLSPTIPGGITNTLPYAPNYAIQVGICINADPVNGRILVMPSFLSTNYNNIVGTVAVSGGGTGEVTINGILSTLSAAKTTDVQILSTPGNYTWNKPVGAKYINVTLIGGGGGGGSGGTSGGAGGGGGGCWEGTLRASDVTDTVTVTVGTSGSGGVNAVGTSGGSTSFGSYMRVTGGGGGSRTTSNSSAGVYAGNQGGGGGGGGNGITGVRFSRGGAGGGGGGDYNSNGGNGGSGGAGLVPGGTGGAGSVGSNNGDNGGNGSWSGVYGVSTSSGGGGGGGGDTSVTTTLPGNGGDGGGFGTGGGGGGVSATTFGRGGNGGVGLAVIETIF